MSMPQSPPASQGSVVPAAFTQAPASDPPASPTKDQGSAEEGGQSAPPSSLPSAVANPLVMGSPPASMLPGRGSRLALNELNAAADRVPFDWRQVQVRQDGRNWQLMSGATPLMSFGGNEQDARLALATLQHYHFTEHDMIGHPQPVFSYFLAEGQAPRGVMVGVDSVSFKPAALVVRKVNENWSICEGQQVLLSFGSRGDQAWAAKGIIDRYKFDHLCHIGHEGTGMTFLVRTH